MDQFYHLIVFFRSGLFFKLLDLREFFDLLIGIAAKDLPIGQSIASRVLDHYGPTLEQIHGLLLIKVKVGFPSVSPIVPHCLIFLIPAFNQNG